MSGTMMSQMMMNCVIKSQVTMSQLIMTQVAIIITIRSRWEEGGERERRVILVMNFISKLIERSRGNGHCNGECVCVGGEGDGGTRMTSVVIYYA